MESTEFDLGNKIKIGLFAFTSVGAGQHGTFNRWHSYEHMPEFLTAEGEPWAVRYVSTPELMSLRPTADPTFAPSQYFICYFLQSPANKSLGDHTAVNDRLAKEGHYPEGVRGTQFMGAFDFAGAYLAPRLQDTVSPEALLYRPQKGVHITLVDLEDPSHADQVANWYDQVHFPDMLTLKGFSGAWRFTSRGHPFAGFENPPYRFMHIYFLDEEPTECVADLRLKLPKWVESGRGLPECPRRVVCAGSFRSITEVDYGTLDKLPWQ